MAQQPRMHTRAPRETPSYRRLSLSLLVVLFLRHRPRHRPPPRPKSILETFVTAVPTGISIISVTAGATGAAMPTKRPLGRRTTKELWDILRKAVLDGIFNENNTLVAYCFAPLERPLALRELEMQS